ncbi:hypothetical protein A7L03_18970 [Acinetobacter baumannii]|nr:hypothetical protein A7L03_18970 [Acinetobacter baumannii]
MSTGSSSNSSRGVSALVGRVLLGCLQGDGNTSLHASRLLNIREPDLPASAPSAGASPEANFASRIIKDEVTPVVDLEGATLLVLADGLDTGGVADVALAHSAAVNVQLERGVEGVDVDGAVLLVECKGGVVDVVDDVLAVAVDGAGLVGLIGAVDDEATFCGLDGAVLDGGAGSHRHQTEDVVGPRAREGGRSLGKGGGEGGHGGGGGGGGELHVDGVEVVLLKCGSGSCSV